MNNQTIASLRKRGGEIHSDIVRWRRALHSVPELRMDTPKTEALILEFLREIGVTDIRSHVGGHGVCAVIQGELPGKCLAIRADCDGLPIKEETGLHFASRNDNMHACGHDSHTAMALGAAKLLVENRHKLKGCVKFIFQPYEEGDGGAKLMISDGALENPKVDAIIALHNHPTPDKDYIPGDILVTREPISANIYAYEATFFGEQSHICLSNEAKNPVYMAALAVSNIAALEKKSGAVNAVSMIHGGVRNNIIPDTCTISGSIRAFDKKEHDSMKKAIVDIINDSAKTFGGKVEITTTIDLMATDIEENLYVRFCNSTNSTYPERTCVTLKDRELIGEDFARFASLVPAVYFKLHTEPRGISYPLHHPKFDVDESVLHKGSIVFSAFALCWQD